MSDNDKKCLLCEMPCSCKPESTQDRFYPCENGCGIYAVPWSVYEYLKVSESTEMRLRLAALMREKRLFLKAPVFLWRNARPANIHRDYVDVNIDELLQQWPSGMLERLDRCLCSLIERARMDGKEFAQGLSSTRENRVRLLSLSTSVDESKAITRLMEERGWITEKVVSRSDSCISVLASGWERYEQLIRGKANRNNPAFVAMWFGRPKKNGDSDRSAEMTELFTNSIEAACNAGGWKALRVDMVEHNDSVIDRIIFEIQRAPFVIADLTENNQGVYFEAGYAKGLGKEVIYCCPSGSKAHFDVDGINHVKYSTPDELRQKLKNRILGTLGKGTHNLQEQQ